MVHWSTTASASNLSRFLGVKLICLARGAFGFTGGVTNWYIAPYQGTFSLFTDTHFLNIDTDTAVQGRIQKLMYRFLPRHVFSVRSADTDFLITDTDTVVQTRIQKNNSLLRLKARFLCPLCWYTLSKSAPSTQYHSAPVYITKTHFYDWNTKAFLVCLLLTPWCYWLLLPGLLYRCHRKISLAFWTVLVSDRFFSYDQCKRM